MSEWTGARPRARRRPLARRSRTHRPRHAALLRVHCPGGVRAALLAVQLMPGLSLGILLGALVIVASWVLTWIYVRWANTTTTRSPALRRRLMTQASRHAIGAAEHHRHGVLLRLHRHHARHHLLGGASAPGPPSISTRRAARISAGQNGFALAGDYMSAASFLGIAGLVSTTGFDGLIYSTGWLVGWPVVLFLIAEPLRNLGKYTFADVVAHRLRQTPVRIAAALGTLATVMLLPDRADGGRRRPHPADVRPVSTRRRSCSSGAP